MGFFGKIKQWLGIGGAKVTLEVPQTFAKDATEVEGTIKITTKSEQTIVKLEVVFQEKYTTGTGDDKSTSEFEWGKLEWKDAFVIKPGEEKVIPFKLPISRPLSKNQEMAESGGLMGGLGKAASFMSGEKSKYYVEVSADVKGAAIDPSDSKEVKFK